MPQAYEQAIAEVVRRRKFRQILNSDVERLKDFINVERLKRARFSKDVHTYLPSQFLPNLRDAAPNLVIEGPSNELEFPNMEESVQTQYLADCKVESPFA